MEDIPSDESTEHTPDDADSTGRLCPDALGGFDPSNPDLVLSLLADRRRRLLLATLSATGEATPAELARTIAAAEGVDLDATDARRYVSSVLTSLYHVHLPALESAGVLVIEGDTVRTLGTTRDYERMRRTLSNVANTLVS